jgi:hypothetical protein
VEADCRQLVGVRWPPRARVIARQVKPGYYDLTATAGGVTFYNARKLFAPKPDTVWHLQRLGELLGTNGPWLGKWHVDI